MKELSKGINSFNLAKILIFILVITALFFYLSCKLVPVFLNTTKVNNISNANQQEVKIFINNVKRFINTNYYTKETNFSLTEPELLQLSWLKKNSYSTTEKTFITSKNSLPIEVRRVLTRLYCLHLLRFNKQSFYKKLVFPQLNSERDIYNNKLTYKSYKKISNKVVSLSNKEYEALRVAIIVASLAKSKYAMTEAKQYFDENNIPNDSIDFLSYTVNNNMKMYPLLRRYLDNNPDKSFLFKVTLSSKMHLRHMIFTEGGIGMFKYLREKIKYQAITKKELNFWYCFWMMNIAGFHGHLDPKGSLMLNENIFQSANILNYHMEKMFKEPNHNPIIPYLLYRADLLYFDKQKLSQQDTLILATLAAVMRVYDSERGKELVQGLFNLTKQEKNFIYSELNFLFNRYEETTPSYAPAFFLNCHSYLNNNLQKTVELITPLYGKIIQKYRELEEKNKISPSTRLSFYNISKKESIQRIFTKLQEKSDINFEILPNGSVALTD